MELVDIKMIELNDIEIEYLYNAIKHNLINSHPYISLIDINLKDEDKNEFISYCKEGPVVVMLNKRLNGIK